MSTGRSDLRAPRREPLEAVGDVDPKSFSGEVHPIPTARVPERRGQAEPDAAAELESLEGLSRRLARVERHNRWLKFGLVALFALGCFATYERIFPEGVIIQKTMMESKELKLLDSDGHARLFLRMYSRVPVLQIMDANGKPRMSLGLRFDDTPFIDLSDKRGNTRATFEMTEDDSPALRLFDEQGATTFKIN